MNNNKINTKNREDYLNEVIKTYPDPSLNKLLDFYRTGVINMPQAINNIVRNHMNTPMSKKEEFVEAKLKRYAGIKDKEDDYEAATKIQKGC